MMRATPHVEEILAHAMILVSKLDNSDQYKDLKLSNRELNITGIKRTHHDDDTILNDVSQQVKYLKKGLTELLDKPKYIGVGLLKQIKTKLQNEGINLSNYTGCDDDSAEEEEEKDEEKKSDSESIDGEESDESEDEEEEEESEEEDSEEEYDDSSSKSGSE